MQHVTMRAARKAYAGRTTIAPAQFERVTDPISGMSHQELKAPRLRTRARRTLSFRAWARSEYANEPSLSPKLSRIVRGKV
jgi:hypothetical protein